MDETRKRAIKMFWKFAKEKCPFQTEEIVNGYLEGFIDCAEYLLLQNTELEKELEQAKKVQVVEHFEAYGQCRDSRRIASLEKENAELKDKLNNLSKVAEVRLANWQKYEQENAELKERADKADLDSVTFFNQLCKAKEIIKDFLSLGIFGIFKGTTAEEIVDKAEDFLKEDK